MTILIAISTLLIIASQCGKSIWLSMWSNDRPVNGTQDIPLRNLRLGVFGGLGIVEGGWLNMEIDYLHNAKICSSNGSGYPIDRQYMRCHSIGGQYRSCDSNKQLVHKMSVAWAASFLSISTLTVTHIEEKVHGHSQTPELTLNGQYLLLCMSRRTFISLHVLQCTVMPTVH